MRGLTFISKYTLGLNFPLYDCSEAQITRLCLDNITSVFPTYPPHGKVLNDIRSAYQQAGGNITKVPSIPKEVGDCQTSRLEMSTITKNWVPDILS